MLIILILKMVSIMPIADHDISTSLVLGGWKSIPAYDWWSPSGSLMQVKDQPTFVIFVILFLDFNAGKLHAGA